MAKTNLLYTITDLDGNVIIKDAESIVAANAIGTNRIYMQQCANQGRLCHKKYIITVKGKTLDKVNNTGAENYTRELADDWDNTMYGIRKRLGLDMSRWNEFLGRKRADTNATT